MIKSNGAILGMNQKLSEIADELPFNSNLKSNGFSIIIII
jgi:hypothetical protein